MIETRKYLVRAGLGLVVLLLQGCFAAREYARPDTGFMDKLYRTDELPADSVSIASISWRTLFTDPVLAEYIEEGLQDNLDIRIALQRLAAAEAFMKRGKAGYLPGVQARASLTHQELARNSQFGSFFDGALQQYELSGSFTWEADVWGKIRSNRRAALASYLQQVAAHKAVKTELIAQIAGNYYLLLALDEKRSVTLQTIENRERSLKTIEALKRAGNLTQVAVDQAAAQVYNSRALLLDIEELIFRAENNLAFLLGRTAQPVARGLLKEQEPRKDLDPGIPALLLRNRPDVIASEYELINAFELSNVARSQFYPSIMITGTTGYQSLLLDQWIDAGSVFANIVGSLTQPIFNRREIRTAYEVANARQQESLYNFEKTLLIAGQEVTNSVYAFKAETKKYEFRLLEVEALQRAENHSETLLANGFGTYLDLLTARQSSLNAKLNAVDNKLGQLLAMIELYRAVGGGWQ